MVGALVIIVFVALLQVALGVYARNVLTDAAGEGARRAALAGGTEQRLSQLAKWIVEAEAQGLSYALRLPDAFFDFGHGREQREACLRALALFGGGA